MEKVQKTKIYDLEKRTLEYGKRIIHLCRSLSKDTINNTISSQLARSGTSLGANYREANETVTKKDFSFRCAFVEKKEKKRYIGSSSS